METPSKDQYVNRHFGDTGLELSGKKNARAKTHGEILREQRSAKKSPYHTPNKSVNLEKEKY